MSEPFIGQIVMFAGNFAPRGWAFCDGQLLAINSNQALFAILGTTYGGDGRTTFGLPDLRGRFPMHPGNGPGLSPRQLGARSGQETVTLNVTQIPSHNHNATLEVSNTAADDHQPAGNYLGAASADVYTQTRSGNESLNSGATTNTGGNQPHDNMPPWQTVNFIIALQGVFPSRS
ncbi:MAG: phage tail protein [Bradymonadia bacterium]